MNTLTFGSLFAGIGGFDLGMERAGLECRWQVEINPLCRRVLAKNWPDVTRHDDVRSFPYGGQGRWDVDVVVGGFPCKQTSNASAIHGKRSGLDGADSGLWHEQRRIIETIRPRWAVVENVSGVEAWSAEITRGLEGSGYRVSELSFSAEDVGAPHRRRRVFFVANLDGKGLSLTWEAGSPEAEFLARRATAGDTWAANLSGLRRVDDGVPAVLDRRERIVALGNAVVPAMAELIGILLMHNERLHP